MSGVSTYTAVIGLVLSLVPLSLVTTRPATAQEVSLGFKGGLNSSTVSSADPERAKTRIGFNVGGSVWIQSAGPFALQFGAVYSRKGSKGFDVPETRYGGPVGGFELTYVEVPVLATIVFPTGPASKVAPLVFAGPAIGIQVGCKTKIAYGTGLTGGGGGVVGPGDCSEGGAPTKSMDAGLMSGGGLKIESGPASVILEVAYTLGLINVYDGVFGPAKVKNRNLSFSIGIMFPFGVGRTPGL